VDDALFVGGVDGTSQGFHELSGLPRRLRRAVKPFGQGAALHQFQGQEGQPLVFPDFIDLHDVRVPQAGKRFRFSAEASQLRRRCVLARPEHL
jgi:hypothetical protein